MSRDRITEAGLRRIIEHCRGTGCLSCGISELCANFQIRSTGLHISPFPADWKDDDITAILAVTNGSLTKEKK